MLVIEKEIATSISASYRGGSLNLTRLSIHASPRGKNTIEVLETEIEKILKEIVDNGVSQEELDHARNSMIKSAIYARDSQTTMAQIIGAVLAMDGELSDVLDWSENLKKVSVKQVNKAAKKYLVNKRSVTGYLLPKVKSDELKKS